MAGLAAIVVAGLVSGCPAEHNGVVGAAAPLRFTQHVSEKAANRQRPDYDALSESARVFAADEGATPDQGVPEYDRTGLLLNVDIDADDYNECLVTMKADAGEWAALAWAGDLEPFLESNPGITTPILTDGEFHTYRFDLSPLVTDTWEGHVTTLLLVPSDAPGKTEVQSVRLRYVPPRGPKRITIDGVTHEAFYGTQVPWELDVPPNGVFEVSVGMPGRSWRWSPTDGARFWARLRTEDSDWITLVDDTLRPVQDENHRRWQRHEVDLAAYAGQRVIISMQVDPVEGTGGDYAYWGNPMVFSRARGEAVPVVLISCDSLRADHVSCYGYSRPTTPFLDQWAGSEAVMFENAMTEATWTLPAHMTMLTGMVPGRHRVTSLANLGEETVTLTEELVRHGYFTAGFTGHDGWLMPWRGYAQGFDIYDTPGGFRDVTFTVLEVDYWLRNHPFTNTFLFFHNYDIHLKPDDGYERFYDTGSPEFRAFSRGKGPAELEPRFNGVDTPLEVLAQHNGGTRLLTASVPPFLTDCYDDCIPYVDQAIADLFQRLKDRDLYDQALIIVTSDHGEEFADHGRYVHSQVYQELSHIPLFIRFPRGEHGGKRIGSIVQLADLYPTVLEALGFPIPDGLDGRSLLPLLQGETWPDRIAYSEQGRHKAVRMGNLKLVRKQDAGNVLELYDLEADRHERHNLFDSRPQEAEPLLQELERVFDAESEGWHFRFFNDSTPWKATVTVRTDDWIEEAGFYEAFEFKPLEKGVEKSQARFTILLGPDIPHTEIIVRTASPQARISVEVEGESPFRLAEDDEAAQPRSSFSAVFDGKDENMPHGPAPVQARRPIPTLSVWCGEATSGRTPAKPATEKDLDALRAVGYM